MIRLVSEFTIFLFLDVKKVFVLKFNVFLFVAHLSIPQKVDHILLS